VNRRIEMIRILQARSPEAFQPNCLRAERGEKHLLDHLLLRLRRRSGCVFHGYIAGLIGLCSSRQPVLEVGASALLFLEIHGCYAALKWC